MAILTGYAKMGNRLIQYTVDVEGAEFALMRSDHHETRIVMTGTLDECKRVFLARTWVTRYDTKGQKMAILTGYAKMGNRMIQYTVDVEGAEFALMRSDHHETRIVMTGTLDECERVFLARID